MKKVILKIIITHAVPLHECGELMFFRNIKPMFVGYSESEQPGGHSNFPFLAMTAAQDNCSPRQWKLCKACFHMLVAHEEQSSLPPCKCNSSFLYGGVPLASLRLSHSGAAGTRSGTTLASKSVVERPVRHSGVLSRTWRSTSRQFSTEKWFLGCRDVVDQSFYV